jgi:hypothetical protein
MISYVGLDHDRGCDVIWNVINITNLTKEHQEKLYEELLRMKNLKHENINTISEVWLKDKESSEMKNSKHEYIIFELALKEKELVFITDSFFGGSIRQ